MTKSEVERVLSLFAHWPEGSIARFFARNPTTQDVFGASASSARWLCDYANWADEMGFNSYIQVNPTNKQEGTRCRAEDISHWCWFLLDIDPVLPYADPMEALAKAESLLKAQFGLTKLSRVIIDSGRGVQAWYPLGPIPTNDVFRAHTDPLPRLFELEDVPSVVKEMTVGEAAPRAMAYWLGWLNERMGTHEGCNIDTSVSDLPRVMRLPYTINQKTGRKASIFDTYHGGVNETLAHKLLSYAPYKVWQDRPVVDVPSGASWTEYVGHMTRGGRVFLTEGQDEPGRHRAASAAMLSLMDLGCDPEQIKAALRFGGSLCTPCLPASETNQMVDRRFNVKA